MALMMVEGFEWTNNANHMVRKWSDHTSSGFTTGRFSTRAIRMDSGSHLLRKIFPTSHTTWTIGCAFQCTWGFNDGYTAISMGCSAGDQIRINFSGAGAMRVVRGDGTILQTATQIPVTVNGGWKYLEFQAYIHAWAGYYEVRWDGVTFLSGSNVNTKGQNTVYDVDRITFAGSARYDYDDIYICDGSGATFNTFLGPQSVKRQSLLAAGSSTQWTPINSTNLSQINDTTAPDDDTSRVQAVVTSEKVDLYTITNNVRAGSNVQAVYVGVEGKGLVGAGGIVPALKSGSTTVGNPQPTDGYYKDYGLVVTTDPNTGSAWTVSGLNSIEVGMKNVVTVTDPHTQWQNAPTPWNSARTKIGG